MEISHHIFIRVSLSATTFYVWLTSPQSDYFDELTGSLLKRGFSVSPLGRAGILSYVDKPAHVVAISVQRTPKNKEEEAAYTASGIHDEVMDIIKILKAKIFSIVVSKASICTWNTGNMSVEEMERDDLQKRMLIN